MNDHDRSSSWTAIVITAPNRESAYAFDFGLLIFESDVIVDTWQSSDLFLVLRQRQRYGLIDPSTIILTVDDPQEKLGSGGATLNALLVVTEHLSAKAGCFCEFYTRAFSNRWLHFFGLARQYQCATVGTYFNPAYSQSSCCILIGL